MPLNFEKDKMKDIKKIIAITILMALSVFVWEHIKILADGSKTGHGGLTAGVNSLERVEAPAILSSIFDIQRELVKRGYPVEVDGIITTGGETLEAWNDSLYKQFAREAMKKTLNSNP